jgi:2,4'-dihydroxyacetophenone dioxygenase
MATLSDTVLRQDTGSMRFPDGSSIVRPVELAWTPWAIPGASFKLLSVNRRSGTWSCIVHFDPDTRVPAQRHFGDCFIYVMQGDYVTDDAAVQTGQFSVETGGTANARTVGSRGLKAYMMFQGGFGALDDEGQPTGQFIDAEWAYAAAHTNGAADHIPPAPVIRTQHRR